MIMLDILSKKYYFFGLSFLLIIPGLIVMAIWGLPLAIDFVGGSLLELQFDSGIMPEPAQVIELYNDLGIAEPQVQTSGSNNLIIRSAVLDEAESIRDEIESRFNTEVTILQFDTVGPTIGKEVTSRAVLAVIVAAIGVILYIIYAFRGVSHAYLDAIGCAGSTFNFVSPDFYQLVPWEGDGAKPVGYGYESVAANIETMCRIESAVAGLDDVEVGHHVAVLIPYEPGSRAAFDPRRVQREEAPAHRDLADVDRRRRGSAEDFDVALLFPGQVGG